MESTNTPSRAPEPQAVGLTTRRREIRPDIQALRAVAVVLVVVYHALPDSPLTGGYIGVDVFFVISGFLITSHIAHQLKVPQRFSITDFYIRRARRLLPASLLTLFVVSITTIAFVPITSWRWGGQQIIASTLYVQNWILANGSVDYLAAGAESSPLRHFWSLSLEEQFYFIWPVLLVAGVAVCRRHLGRVQAMRGVVALVFVASLTYSVILTATAPSIAYFATPTRVWELAAGGLLALTVPAMNGSTTLRVCLAWAGLLAIAVAAVTFDDSTPFPGATALVPVLGTVAAIAAGNPHHPLSAGRLMQYRPVQFLGDHSYSIYLWHWPLLVLGPVIALGPGREFPLIGRVALAAASIPIAYVTKRFVEDRFRADAPTRTLSAGPDTSSVMDRRSPASHRRPAVVMVAAMTVVVALGLVPYGISKVSVSHGRAGLAQFQAADQSCVGAAALESRCSSYRFDTIQPDPVLAATNVWSMACFEGTNGYTPVRCDYGSSSPSAPRVAVVGDSHADQWMPAIVEIAEQQGWHVTTWFKTACPFTAGANNPSCRAWNESVSRELQSGGFGMVITSTRSGVDYAGRTNLEAAADGLATAWRPLVASQTQVVALADVPQPRMAGMSDPAGCVAADLDCDIQESAALRDDPLPGAARLAGARLIDLRDRFCVDGTCPAIIGGVLVYRDDDHMTAVYARSLSRYLGPILASRG